jgi:hypothetical protein
MGPGQSVVFSMRCDAMRCGAVRCSWVRYRGDLNIYYRETVTVVNINGNNSQALTRTGRLVPPIDM